MKLTASINLIVLSHVEVNTVQTLKWYDVAIIATKNIYPLSL